MIFRGRLEDAQNLAQAPHDLARGDQIEYYLEHARLEHARANWSGAFELISLALSLSPPALTFMTLLQMKALSQYELGDFSGALLSCSKAESLLELFPHSSSVPYLFCIKAKAVSRAQGPIDGLSVLKDAWRFLDQKGDLTPDAVSALLRSECHIRRLCGLDALPQAIAYSRIEHAMAEELFMALGLLDCFLSASAEIRAHLKPTLNLNVTQYERVRRELQQVEVDDLPQAASQFSVQDYLDGMSSKFLLVCVPGSTHLIQIQPWKVLELSKYPKLKTAVILLRNGSVSQKKMLESIWSIKAVSREKHGNLIPGITHRLKKMMGNPVLQVEQNVSADGVFYVG
jgi:hypothetical protein